MRIRQLVALGFATATLGMAAGCATDTPSLEISPVRLDAVFPTGGSTGVSVGAKVTVTFNHAVMAGMEQHAALHEGEVSGRLVAGTWSVSTDRTVLTFSPAQPLKPATKYTIHLGGGMMGADGRPVDFSQNQQRCGGQWATYGMMNGVGGGMMGSGGGMMGQGWQGANGTFGMIFQFTTA